MIRTICKIDNEEEIKRLLNNVALYLRNKLRPFLFMVGEKDKLRSETMDTISQMLINSKVASPPAPRSSKVSVSGDNMQIDQMNVTINIDDNNPFGGFECNELDTKDIEEKLR